MQYAGTAMEHSLRCFCTLDAPDHFWHLLSVPFHKIKTKIESF